MKVLMSFPHLRIPCDGRLGLGVGQVSRGCLVLLLNLPENKERMEESQSHRHARLMPRGEKRNTGPGLDDCSGSVAFPSGRVALLDVAQVPDLQRAAGTKERTAAPCHACPTCFSGTSSSCPVPQCQENSANTMPSLFGTPFCEQRE